MDRDRNLLNEINEKIKNRSPPMDRDKELLQFQLDHCLTEEEHFYIFTEILQVLPRKIYTITENCTLLNLNDLEHRRFLENCAIMLNFRSNITNDNTIINNVHKKMIK